jgi:hypothetical protein
MLAMDDSPLLGIAVAILICIASTGWGLLVLDALAALFKFFHKILDWPHGIKLWVFLLPLGFGIISLILLFAGMFGLIYLWLAWLIIIIGFYRVLLELYKKAPLRVSSRKFFEWLKTLKFIQVALLLIIIGNLLYPLLRNGLVPPSEWDELAYHLAVPKLYIDAHRIYYIPFIFQSNWPLGSQMLFMQGLLLGSGLASHLLTWVMGVWIVLGLYYTGEIIIPGGGLWAAALFSGIPIMQRLLATGLVDVSLPFWGIYAFYAFFVYLKTRNNSMLVLTGLMSGFAANCKTTGALYLFVIFVALFIFTNRNIKKSFSPFLSLMIPGILVSLPWYLRSFIFTGNPFFPFFFNILGGNNWDATGDMINRILWGKIFIKLPLTITGLYRSIQYLFLSPGTLGGYGGGIGFPLLLLSLCGCLYGVLKRSVNKYIWFLMGFTLFFYLVWFSMGMLEIRYLHPIFISLALMGAIPLVFLNEVGWNDKFAFSLQFLFVLILVGYSPWISSSNRSELKWRFQAAVSTQAREDYLYNKVDILPAFQWMNQNLEQDARILLLPYENRGYYLDRDYIWGHLGAQRIIRFEEFQQPEELYYKLKALGVTHILDSTTWMFTDLSEWPQARKLMLDFYAHCTSTINQWEKQTLFALRPCQ